MRTEIRVRYQNPPKNIESEDTVEILASSGRRAGGLLVSGGSGSQNDTVGFMDLAGAKRVVEFLNEWIGEVER